LVAGSAATLGGLAGSRAHHDLIEFTLLKAYIEASRLEDARRLLGARRPGTSGIPVMGVAAVHLTGIEIEPTCRHPRAPQRHLGYLCTGYPA
jgi:hypothetical protein